MNYKGKLEKPTICEPVEEQNPEITEDNIEECDENAEEEKDPRYTLTEEQEKTLSLNEDTLTAICDVFRTLDEDGSGSLEVAELEVAMKRMDVEYSKGEIQELVKQIDKDGNGSVELFEFSKMVSEKMQDYDPEKELKEAFAVFDKNGDGKVSSDEIKIVVESLGGKMTNEELQNMLLEVDENHDGYLDYEEFVRIWIGDDTPESDRNKDNNVTPDKPETNTDSVASNITKTKPAISNLLTVPKEKT